MKGLYRRLNKSKGYTGRFYDEQQLQTLLTMLKKSISFSFLPDTLRFLCACKGWPDHRGSPGLSAAPLFPGCHSLAAAADGGTEKAAEQA